MQEHHQQAALNRLKTVRGHLEAMRRLAPGAVEMYRATASRELDLAVGRGAITEEQALPLRRLLEEE